MELVEATEDREIGIAEMAQMSGLTPDTLRWYEKEGMLPPVGRGVDGRRAYSGRDRDLVRLLAALRATGMPTSLMKEFVALIAEGAASHGRRIDVLQESRERLESRRREIDEALAALDAKVDHYRQLIDAGLDCDNRPVAASVRRLQRSTDRTLTKEIS
ncbi:MULTISPECIES: MerR family transcriptional regulator [unclassified Yimella]|uniref:MerR family transcriptional regulator n=1 Tax=unclassified Yimella TaxID=2649892 RepID=UPI00197ABC2C|nr:MULTISPECIES: MerR family transcriptional regulator [unclassified Yimella]MCG8656894.1 MerR family transcriptional regulator [Yimella sp. NH-Cas1]